MDSSRQSFLARNDFLIRRLHSLCGLIPVGAYMVVHLLVNASVVNGDATFQNNVLNIHKFGDLLPILEWGFIFIPILFHAIFGFFIIAGGMPNNHNYPYAANYRYTLQRATGVIAFFFIMLHVLHMHGWIHNESWLHYVVRPMGGAQFRPYNATSTAGAALQNGAIVALYIVGVTACVYHLANGIWTMGITWGVWTSPTAQRRASYVCSAFGVLMMVVSATALFGLRAAVDTPEKMREVRAQEDRIVELKIATGDIQPNEHKEAAPLDEEGDAETPDAEAASAAAGN
ncbi:succinate dehydrogenase cytochrome b558 subunit [Lacipirellula sp.]|uniref:succinate dehydrogenase cytochrome b558 subunit n=1 Tax=Lacipirellula sp. TaxID=2691419 RepID=UPI003D148366